MRYGQACLVVVFLILGLTFSHTPARADALGDAVAHFTADDFDETITGINGVAASGSPRAAAILQALQNGALMYSAEKKAVYIQDSDSKLFDAATGRPVPGDPPADLDTVNINNRVRGLIDAALGGLTLLSSNPDKRYGAAQEVFKSHEASALPTLEIALAKEQDSRVKLVLMQARAAILLNSAGASDADKLAAVEVIRQRGDQDALALLSSLPTGTATPVLTAAKAGIAAIQRRLELWDLVQNTWYGLSLGSVLLLAAIGLAITFGVMGVINMAHGEMVMVGAYVTFVVQETIRNHAPGLFDYSLAIAVPLAFIVAGFLGILIERSIIRFL